MKKFLTIASLALFLAACSDDSPALPGDNAGVQESPVIDSPEEYHEKMRTVPYPRSSNVLYVNPAPLIVPQGMKSGARLQFALSSSPDFEEKSTMLSEQVDWNMWNPHRRLATGTWYWRFRNISTSGEAADWSETYSFEVSGDEPDYVTPDWDTFLSMAPQQAPRLYCFLDAKLPAARERLHQHPEYTAFLRQAETELAVNYSNMSGFYTDYERVYQHVDDLYQAYLLTQDERYADKMKSLLEAMIAHPCPASLLYSENFVTSAVTFAHAAICDLLGKRMSAALRESAEAFVAAQCERFYRTNRGYQENHIFDNHFWQKNYRMMFYSALTLYDNTAYPEAIKLLEYLYELWTARAPASGFNRDGVWHNGTGYFGTNTTTLAYMPMLLGYITRFDFTSHPWYRNAGQALAYNIPPSGSNTGFGDMHERYSEPTRQLAAFADFLARETGDGFAAWYATSRADLVRRDLDLRIYRMCNSDTYTAEMPSEARMLQWFKDAGEVSIHSSLTDVADDLSIGFRSSQFGSGSHTTSSQNAFNLAYGGNIIFGSTGYYQSFSDAHNLLWYRHSRSHNTILVNGIGQPYTTKAYGRILRAGSTRNFAYALGDASNAYCGFTDDPMWITNFKNAGVEQSPENGFGPTPLTRYFRHVVVLKPGVTVIYDELEASEAAKWEWLLHSNVKFDIDADGGYLTTTNSTDRNHCRVKLITSATADWSQTSKFLVPPANQSASTPDQWHFTATVESAPAVRVLAIIQPAYIDDDFAEVKTIGDGFAIGNWTIRAELDPSRLASLRIENTRTGSLLDMGSEATVTTTTGSTYRRGYTSSTLIADDTTLELVDEVPAGSRTIH